MTNINPYVSQMLAVSLGIKLCDSTRRILMYTKDSDENKGFYALCRGIFPIQELCGTMTALALAKRDVLGWNMPLWKMLAPAVVIHGMANFRGMKVRVSIESAVMTFPFFALTILVPFCANFPTSQSSNGTRIRLGLRCSCFHGMLPTIRRYRSF